MLTLSTPWASLAPQGPGAPGTLARGVQSRQGARPRVGVSGTAQSRPGSACLTRLSQDDTLSSDG